MTNLQWWLLAVVRFGGGSYYFPFFPFLFSVVEMFQPKVLRRALIKKCKIHPQSLMKKIIWSTAASFSLHWTHWYSWSWKLFAAFSMHFKTLWVVLKRPTTKFHTWDWQSFNPQVNFFVTDLFPLDSEKKIFLGGLKADSLNLSCLLKCSVKVTLIYLDLSL